MTSVNYQKGFDNGFKIGKKYGQEIGMFKGIIIGAIIGIVLTTLNTCSPSPVIDKPIDTGDGPAEETSVMTIGELSKKLSLSGDGNSVSPSQSISVNKCVRVNLGEFVEFAIWWNEDALQYGGSWIQIVAGKSDPILVGTARPHAMVDVFFIGLNGTNLYGVRCDPVGKVIEIRTLKLEIVDCLIS